MKPLTLLEVSKGEYSLLFDVGETLADDSIREMEHEPNGYFWEGVAQWLLRTTLCELGGKFEFDSDAAMFCVQGRDPEKLRTLGKHISAIVNEREVVQVLIKSASDAGFEFDD